MRYAIAALIVLAGCSRRDDVAAQRAREVPLERAAIAAGVIPDPLSSDLTGLYVRDTDRICIVPAAQGFRIGASVTYQSGPGCDAAGTVKRDGAVLHVDLGRDCRFDARFDGDLIAFPAQLSSACQALCGGRPTLASMTVSRLSNSPSEAASMQDGAGKLPCS